MINLLYEAKRGKPAVAWITEPHYGPLGSEYPESVALLLYTSLLIHSWVTVRLGSVEFRTVQSIMPAPFRVAGMQKFDYMLPYRHPEMIYLSATRDFGETVHIINDDENDNIAELSRKFYRQGLWFSAHAAPKKTIIGYGDYLYVVPEADKRFSNDLKNKGASVLAKFDVFPDPTREKGRTTAEDATSLGLVNAIAGLSSAVEPLADPKVGNRPDALNKHENQRAEMEAILYECSSCGRELRIPTRYAGTAGKCNHCGHRIIVPRRS